MNTARPVTHADIRNLPEQINLSVNDMLWAFGLSMPTWGSLKNTLDEQAKPVLALLGRWLSDHPDENVPLRAPTPAELFDMLNVTLGENAPSLKFFGLHLGLDGTGGYRWITLGGGCHGATKRAMSIILGEGQFGLENRWQEWVEMAQAEARLRGISDLMTANSWTCQTAS
jgi:hypothetical protein